VNSMEQKTQVFFVKLMSRNSTLEKERMFRRRRERIRTKITLGCNCSFHFSSDWFIKRNCFLGVHRECQCIPTFTYLQVLPPHPIRATPPSNFNQLMHKHGYIDKFSGQECVSLCRIYGFFSMIRIEPRIPT
jgi:hypothetical protein